MCTPRPHVKWDLLGFISLSDTLWRLQYLALCSGDSELPLMWQGPHSPVLLPRDLFLGCFMLTHVDQTSSRSVMSRTEMWWLLSYIPAFASHLMVFSSWEKHTSAYQVTLSSLWQGVQNPHHSSVLPQDRKEPKPWSYASHGLRFSPPLNHSHFLGPSLHHKGGAGPVGVPAPRGWSWKYFRSTYPALLFCFVFLQCTS